MTAFVGPNGHGKTNLVEAIHYTATLGSHRVANDAPLVRAGATRAIVRTEIRSQYDRDVVVELEINPGRANRARVNRSPVPRPREVLGLLRTVLFAPEDLALVKGDPSERRRFLDELLTLRSPRMAGVRQDYDRVLKQRNSLLRSASMARRQNRSGAAEGQLRTLEVWDSHLARPGPELLATRLELLESLRPLVSGSYDAVARGKGDARLEYKSSVPLEPGVVSREQLAEVLLQRGARDSGRTSSTGVCRWSVRTATTSYWGSGTCLRRGTRVTVSRGRSRSRCGWRRTNCSERTGVSRC